MRTVAFHSYKGGTGKTTLAVNLAAVLAGKGFKVLLIDMDVYAPSLYVYFDFSPTKWINDYFAERNGMSEVIYDFTTTINKYQLKDFNNKGLFHIVFSNPAKDEITSLDLITRKESSKADMLKKMLNIRERRLTLTNYDYLILDTSPGIRYWSINSLAISDILILSLKMDNIDVVGTKHMARDVYSSFTLFGAKSYLLLNRVAGYCHPQLTPNLQGNSHMKLHQFESSVKEQSNTITDLEESIQMPVISQIPCYCDIQFEKQEYLTALTNPEHPFASRIDELIGKI